MCITKTGIEFSQSFAGAIKHRTLMHIETKMKANKITCHKHIECENHTFIVRTTTLSIIQSIHQTTYAGLFFDVILDLTFQRGYNWEIEYVGCTKCLVCVR